MQNAHFRYVRDAILWGQRTKPSQPSCPGSFNKQVVGADSQHFARDFGLEIGDLKDAMLDREIWRKIVEVFFIVDCPK